MLVKDQYSETCALYLSFWACYGFDIKQLCSSDIQEYNINIAMLESLCGIQEKHQLSECGPIIATFKRNYAFSQKTFYVKY